MQYREMPSGFFVVLDPGDEILESVTRFATETGVRAAWIQGIGAVRRLTLGFYDLSTQSYSHRTWEEEMEICALSGNLAEVDGGPYPHLHGVFGTRDFATVGGHLFEAVTSVAIELAVVTAPEPIRRQAVDFCDLKLIHL